LAVQLLYMAGFRPLLVLSLTSADPLDEDVVAARGARRRRGARASTGEVEAARARAPRQTTSPHSRVVVSVLREDHQRKVAAQWNDARARNGWTRTSRVPTITSSRRSASTSRHSGVSLRSPPSSADGASPPRRLEVRQGKECSLAAPSPVSLQSFFTTVQRTLSKTMRSTYASASCPCTRGARWRTRKAVVLPRPVRAALVHQEHEFADDWNAA
jgi:hypothetical protein